MPSSPFRFIHASDLELDRTPGGITEVPERLRDLFLEASYLTAERVFETVLADRADFLVLAGNVLDVARTGPRGPLFLVEQFQRLHDRRIAVYWAGGRTDPPGSWPAVLPLLENVHVFSAAGPEGVVCQRDGRVLARLVGQSRGGQNKLHPPDFLADAEGLFTIGVGQATVDVTTLAASGVDYWALGGRKTQHSLCASPRIAHYCGAPQGRRPSETGVHGCTLVDVDADGRVRLQQRPTDLFRWRSEHIELPPGADRDALSRALSARTQAIVAESPGLDLLISWTVTGGDPVAAQLRRGPLAAELLEWLRREHGCQSPAAWSLSLASPPSVPPTLEHDGEGALAGDFLRALRRHQEDHSIPLDLGPYLGRVDDPRLAALAHVDDPLVRASLLERSLTLGMELLTAEGPQP